VIKLRTFFWNLLPWFTPLFFLFLLLRTFVYFQLQGSPIIADTHLSFIWFGLLFDFILVFGIWGFSSLLFASLQALLPKVKFTFLFFLLPLTLLYSNVILDQCYLTMGEPLDESIFLFSKEELWIILGLQQRLTLATSLALLALLLIYFLLVRLFYFVLKNKPILSNSFLFYFSCLALFYLPFSRYTKTENLSQEAIINNRLLFFLDECVRFSIQSERSSKKIYKADFKKLDPEFFGAARNVTIFPTWHKLPIKSSLSPYFNKTTNGKPPNIVFIIGESMSSDFFGERSKNTGCLMPFMDSLSKNSLYFPNTFATSQRTHNVLPAIFSSVPNIFDGAVFQQIAYPNHWSLMGLLRKSYFTSFYCGVDLQYLNMQGFMDYHQVDYSVNHWSKARVQHSDSINSPWGFPDEDLFKQAIEDDSLSTYQDKASFKIFLTISSHDPFIYPEKSVYTQKVTEKASEISNPKHRNLILKNASNFGSFIYCDEQIKAFLQEQSKSPEYQNTIYIITGDHGSELYNESKLSKYNVPLVIFSPLLKQNFKSKALVSHNDIAPSLLNYLRLNYPISVPDSIPFVGKELLFLPYFKANRAFVFTTNKLKSEEGIFYDKVYLANQVYLLNKDLSLTKKSDSNAASFFKEQFSQYQFFSQYCIIQNNLVPIKHHHIWFEDKGWVKVKSKASAIHPSNANNRMVFLGAFTMVPKVENIKIQVTGMVFCRTKTELNLMGDVLIKLKHDRWLNKDQLLFKGIRPNFEERFKPNAWNKIVYTLEFNPSKAKKLGNSKELYLYLFNDQKRKVRIKELQFMLSKKV
jgi:phosphoglycerol transferase MdoB-like AlkP superfamily enzyme